MRTIPYASCHNLADRPDGGTGRTTWERTLKIRRSIAAVGMLGLGLLVAAGCQPNPPAPTVRGYKFEIVRVGPVLVGEDENGDPVGLTNTPPEVEVAFRDDECAPVAQAANFDWLHGMIMLDGRMYDAWYVGNGSLQAIVPADPKCLPEADGSNYDLIATADQVDGDTAVGFILDERNGRDTDFPLYKLVK